MVITADTIERIFELIRKDYSYEEIISKYFTSREWKNEFRQEIYLNILEMEREKLFRLWNAGEFKWFFCSLVKNEAVSSTSYWYRKNRKWNAERLDDGVDVKYLNAKYQNFNSENSEEEYEEQHQQNVEKINRMNTIINEQIENDPHLLKDFTLFKMQYFQGLKPKQISDKTNIKLRNVYAYISKAHKILLKEMKNKYL